MFTLDQIKTAHAKVKSGADFPKYVQELKQLGVQQYSQFVSDGHTVYKGSAHEVESPAIYGALHIASTSDSIQLAHHLKIHQAGETDYLTFCRHAAEDGVEKWIVDTFNMTCTYYGTAGNTMITEIIPQHRQL